VAAAAERYCHPGGKLTTHLQWLRVFQGGAWFDLAWLLNWFVLSSAHLLERLRDTGR
jgi:hypothetical protein